MYMFVVRICIPWLFGGSLFVNGLFLCRWLNSFRSVEIKIVTQNWVTKCEAYVWNNTTITYSRIYSLYVLEYCSKCGSIVSGLILRAAKAFEYCIFAYYIHSLLTAWIHIRIRELRAYNLWICLRACCCFSHYYYTIAATTAAADYREN